MSRQDRTTVRARIPKVDELNAAAEAEVSRAQSHRRLVIAFLLVAALIGGAAAFVAYGAELWGGHTVPNVINLSRARAEVDLEEAGFVVAVQEVTADEGVGLVQSQIPPAGDRYDEGTTVTITVGVSRTIPEVVGLSLEEAQRLLADAGANNVQVTYHPTDEIAPDTVLGVTPDVGSAFTSATLITITASSSVELPNLVGSSEESAVKQLEALGLSAHVTYVESEEDGHTVVGMSPEPGTPIGDVEGEVALSVSDPYLTSVRALPEYFQHRPADVAASLAKKGFSCKGGDIDDQGNANVRYTNGSTVIRLCSNPFDHLFTAGDKGNVVANGTDFMGVRYEYGSGEISGGAGSISLDGVYTVMAQCGLEGLQGSCTETSIILPKGQEELAAKDGRRFVSAYGTMDGYTWTVLIAQVDKESGGVRVVATYAPSELYSNYNLSRNGNRICDFAAFVDMYITGEIPEVKPAETADKPSENGGPSDPTATPSATSNEGAAENANEEAPNNG